MDFFSLVLFQKIDLSNFYLFKILFVAWKETGEVFLGSFHQIFT